MITDFIITVIYGVVVAIVGFFSILPDVSLPANLLDSVGDISPYYSAMDTVFPMAAMLSILTFELLVIGFYFSYKLIRWAYLKIPFIN